MKNRARNPKLKGRAVNPLRLDPTRTTTLRRAAIADVRRRFARLILALDELIVRQDSFGLKERKRTNPFLVNAFCPTGPGGGIDPSCSPSSSVALSKLSSLPDALPEQSHFDGERGPELHLKQLGYLGIGRVYGMKTADQMKKYQVEMTLDPSEVYYGQSSVTKDQVTKILKGEANAGVESESGTDPVLIVKEDGKYYQQGGHHRSAAEILRTGKFTAKVVEVVGRTKTGAAIFQKPKVTTNERWELKSSPEQLAAFQEWLKKQLRWYVVGMTEDQLWARYVQEGFRKGAGRAFDDLRSKRGPTFRSDDFLQGERRQFLSSSFRRPETVEKVKILASRTFEELNNVGEEIRLKLGRVLTDGLARGDNPRVVAREMTRQLAIPQRRAETIARTEIIRAHAEGQLSAMEDLGVDEVGVMVEWSTAGDDRVCEACAPMEGVVLKLEEAHGMIPRHPNCRCSFIPANVGESRKEQVRGKTKIERQIDLSARLAGDTFDVGIEIDKTRPRALVSPTKNAFCPTGEGGGIDNSCGSTASGVSSSTDRLDLSVSGGDKRIFVEATQKESEVSWINPTRRKAVDATFDLDRSSKSVYLNRVDALVSRKGYAREVVSHVMRELAKQGFEKMSTYVQYVDSDSHSMMQKLGGIRGKETDHGVYWNFDLKNMIHNAFCPTGPGGGVDPTCGAGDGGGSTSAPLRYRDHKGTNHEHNAEIVKASKVKVITPEKHKKDAIEALAHVLESKFLTKQMEGVTVEVTSLGNRHGNMSKHLYVSQESLEQYGPGFMATIVRHELEHKILTSQGVPSPKQESRVRHTAGTWAAIKYGSMATTNPRAAEGFKKAAIEQGVKVL